MSTDRTQGGIVLPVGANGTRLVANAGLFRNERSPSDPRYECWLDEPLIGAHTNNTNGGTAGQRLYSVTSGGTITQISVAGRIGVVRFDTSTSSTAICRLGICGALQSAGNGLVFTPSGSSPTRLIYIARIVTLPTSGENFNIFFGARDVMTGAGSTDHAAVIWGTGNSGLTQGYLTKASANVTFAGTSIPTANTWFEIMAEYTDTSFTAWLNGTQVLSRTDSTTPIVSLAPNVLMQKNAGTTARQVDIDNISIWTRHGTTIY